MRLETDRLILRPWQDSDRRAYAEMAADPEAMRFFPSLMTREQANARIDAFIAQYENDGFGFLATEDKATGQCLGVIGISRLDPMTREAIRGRPEVEIGWSLARKAWGKGLAPEGARACLSYGWSVLKLPEIVAFTSQPNTPSQRVMEKLGMTRDPDGDFDHPKVPQAHPLRPHVLYRITNPEHS